MEPEQYLNKTNNGLNTSYASVTTKLDGEGKIVRELEYRFNLNKDISEASKEIIRNDLKKAFDELYEDPVFIEKNKGYKVGIFIEFTDEAYE